MSRSEDSIEMDYVLRQMFAAAENAILDHECKTSEEEEFIHKFLDQLPEERLRIITEVVKSQARFTRDCMIKKKAVKWFGIGRFEVKAHDQIIYDLTLEEAKELGYTNLEAIKGTRIMQDIKKVVNKKRKSILQEQYWLRRKLHFKTSPSVFIHDFRKGEPLKVRERENNS